MSRRRILKLEPPQPERLGYLLFPAPCLRRHPPTSHPHPLNGWERFGQVEGVQQ